MSLHEMVEDHVEELRHEGAALGDIEPVLLAEQIDQVRPLEAGRAVVQVFVLGRELRGGPCGRVTHLALGLGLGGGRRNRGLFGLVLPVVGEEDTRFSEGFHKDSRPAPSRRGRRSQDEDVDQARRRAPARSSTSTRACIVASASASVRASSPVELSSTAKASDFSASPSSVFGR